MKETTGKLATKPVPKPHGLYWIGARKRNGAPVRFIDGVPARDLTADETAALDAKALIDSGLYTATAPLSTEGDE